MTDRELRKLKRQDLLQMLVAQEEEETPSWFEEE